MEKVNNDNMNDDDKLRGLLSGTKIRAGENLKYRIMQQIQTENLFAGKMETTEKRLNTQINSLLTILGVAYFVLIAIVAGFYLYAGTEIIFIPEFYFSITFVAVVATTFGLISYFDEKTRAKYGHKFGS